MLMFSVFRSSARAGCLLLCISTLPLALLGCVQRTSASEAEQVRGLKVTYIQDLSAEQLKDMMDRGESFDLVDVRSVQEYLAGHLPSAVSIPYAQLPYRYRELSPKTPTVAYCRIGVMSVGTCRMLANLGFTDIYNLTGGYAGWEYGIEFTAGRLVV